MDNGELCPKCGKMQLPPLKAGMIGRKCQNCGLIEEWELPMDEDLYEKFMKGKVIP